MNIIERIVKIEQALARLLARPFIIYAKGTYAPTYLGGTTAGTTTYAADGQVGHYTRIGRLVFFYGRVQWTAATGTGNAQISLPFTPTNVTNLGGSVAIDTNTVTFANSAPQGLLQANAAFFLMRSPLTNAGSAVVQMEAAGIVNFSGFFEVA